MQAKIKFIGETVIVSEKFKKRDVVLTFDNGQYPVDRIHQLSQDKTSLIDGYAVGDVVNVEINYRGREWTSPQGEVKYFNTDEIWKMERVSGAATATQPPVVEQVQETKDDLPF